MAVETKMGLIALKLLIKKLQNHLHLSTRVDYMFGGFDRDEVVTEETVVPDDVKEGHFAIVAKNEKEKPIRFVVELCVLQHPGFLRLLKMAEEEYGFQQSGAIALPCKPEELLRILKAGFWKSSDGRDSNTVC